MPLVSSYNNDGALHCNVHMLLYRLDFDSKPYKVYEEFIDHFFEHYEIEDAPTDLEEKRADFVALFKEGFTHPVDREIVLSPVLKKVIQKMDTIPNENKKLDIFISEMGGGQFIFDVEDEKDKFSIMHKGRPNVWKFHMFKNMQGTYAFSYGSEEENTKYNDNLQNAPTLAASQTKEAIKKIVQEAYEEYLPPRPSLINALTEIFRPDSPSATKEEIVKNKTPILKIATEEIPVGEYVVHGGFSKKFSDKLKSVFNESDFTYYEEGKIVISDPADFEKRIIIQREEEEMKFYGNEGMAREVAQAANVYKTTLEGNPSLRCEIDVDEERSKQMLSDLNTIVDNYFRERQSFKSESLEEGSKVKNKSHERKKTIAIMHDKLRESQQELEEMKKKLSDSQEAGARLKLTKDRNTWESALLTFYKNNGNQKPSPKDIIALAAGHGILGTTGNEFMKFAKDMKYPQNK